MHALGFLRSIQKHGLLSFLDAKIIGAIHLVCASSITIWASILSIYNFYNFLVLSPALQGAVWTGLAMSSMCSIRCFVTFA